VGGLAVLRIGREASVRTAPGRASRARGSSAPGQPRSAHTAEHALFGLDALENALFPRQAEHPGGSDAEDL
ncbi:hypothetical protein, partial [Streptomyces sp. NPDC054958]